MPHTTSAAAFPDPEIERTTTSNVLLDSQLPDKIVALTFDDGPDPDETPEILTVLSQQKVKATFFVIGREVNRYPGLVKREHMQGHLVGNHTYNHRRLTKLSEAEVKQELRDTNTAIRAAGAPEPNLFRPPYGAGATNNAIKRIAANLGMTQTLSHQAYPLINDWKSPPPIEICNRVVSSVRPGSIVPLHDGGSAINTDEALPCIIRQLKAKGYTFGLIYPSSEPNTLNGGSAVEVARQPAK